MSEAEGLTHSTLVNDMAKVVEVDPHVPTLYRFVHVDNLGEIALEQEKRTDIMAELEQLFSAGGLTSMESWSGREDRKFWVTALIVHDKPLC